MRAISVVGRLAGGVERARARKVEQGSRAAGPVSDTLKTASVAINTAGQVAFTANLDDTDNLLEALYATDPAGVLHAIAIVGDGVDVRPGDRRAHDLVDQLLAAELRRCAAVVQRQRLPRVPAGLRQR